MPAADTLTFKLPDLISASPFPSAIHSERSKGTEESIAWICGEDALGTKDINAQAHWTKLFKRWDVPLLTAYAYPYASYDKYLFCSEFVQMQFAIDEITDSLSGEEVKEKVELHIRVLLDGQCDGSPISRMSASFRNRIKQNFKPIAHKRFLKVYQDYTDAVLYEARVRTKEEVLSIREYIIQRRETVGARPCFELIEACLDLEIPDEVMEHPVIRRMINAAADHIHLGNDILSYKKERIQDGPKCSNIITSLIYQNGLSLQGAVDFVGSEMESALAQFLADKESLPSFGPSIDKEVKAFIMGMEYWITANIVASLESKRYFSDDERTTVKETLIVEIPV